MNNQQAVVDQIVQNLAFEVEAVPQNKSIQATSISQSTPLNVKIKVRKKDEIHKQHASIADDTSRAVQKIRLVNSDRTIMTFDVFMEAEFEKKPSRNFRKHIFGMLRPGICLGAVDDDECPYMPSSSYSANITEPNEANKSDGTLRQTFTLSKNVYQDYTVSTQPGGQKWLFGKCKPGGCLDPPFSEDKYSYKPSTRSGPERGEEELLEEDDVGSDIYSKKIPIAVHDEEAQSNGRHSSIFDSGLFKKKRKCSDKSTNTKLPDKTDSIVDIYQGESATNSVSTHSNSIITYPPKVRSDPRISDDKTVKSRGPSEDKSRKSFNEHSEPYFIRPKGVNRIKEKEKLDPKHRSSDATDLRNSLKDSFKMPVPLPIPIPIPIMSNKRKPEAIDTNDNILKTQGDSAKVTELDELQDQESQNQESQDAINLIDTDMPLRLLRDTSVTGDTDDKLMESSKIATLIPFNDDQPITPNEIDAIKLQPLKETDSENNKDDTAQPSKKTKTESLKMSIPVPVPFIFSDTKSETKTTPPTIKDTPFEDSKDMQQNTDPGNISEKSESTATPKTQYIEADAISENYLRTRGGFSDQESDTENPVTIAPKMEDDTELDFKEDEITEGLKESSKQNYIKDKDSIATSNAPAIAAVATAAAAAAFAATAAVTVESSVLYEKPDTDTQQITSSPKKDERKDSQRISLSKLPVLKRSTSISSRSKTSIASVKDKPKRSGSQETHLDNIEHRDSDWSVHKDETRTPLSSEPISAAAAKDKRKRSDSPDKHLDNVGHRDTDLGIHKDEKRTSLSSGPTSAASVKDKTKRSDSPDKYLDNVGHRDTDLGVHKDEKRTSLFSGPTSAASVKDKIKRSDDSPDKHLDYIGQRNTDLGVHKDETRTSLSSGPTSPASVKDKTKRSDSLDKHLDNVGHRDTDLGIYKDEKRTSLSSGPKYEIHSRVAKISEPTIDKEYVNDDKNDSYTISQGRFTDGRNMNFIAAPIIIDNTEPTPNFEPLKEVYRETNLFDEPIKPDHEFDPNGVPFTTKIVSRFRKFDEDDGTHSTVSRELIGTKSVIYDTDENVPTTSANKNAERIPSSDKRVIIPVDRVIPSIQSTSTLKSAMKKDTMSVELGFHSYLNDKNERMLRTFDAANAPTRLSNDSVTVLKSQIRISSNEIRIPVDSEHDMSIQIKKANANQRVSISESGFVNIIDNGRVKKQRSPVQCSDAEMRSSEAKTEVRKENVLESDATDEHFIDYYEKELVPLQLIIKNLRDEIDVLAAQQIIFKEKIFCTNKSKLPRLVHSNKKCFGCVRK